MYSESDIDGAVAAGALPPEAANALRAHVAALRHQPAVDEESFRLLTGFNDIFVAIACGLLLASIAWIGATTHLHGLPGIGVALASWGLAEYFTRRRRMALPSILLLLSFTGGVAAAMIEPLVASNPDFSERTNALIGAGIGLVTAAAAYLHWRRFMVPITVAAGAVALVGVAVSLLLAAMPGLKDQIYAIVLLGGLGVFALAMWWDLSDRERRTRRADVAFWLHLAAAPLIAHPLFHMLGVFGTGYGETLALPQALVVLALYIGFAVVALAIDRRALLVSGLAYVLYALYALFEKAGVVELSWGLTALVIGSALLTLSAFWQPMRRGVVAMLGSLGNRLPPVQLATA